MKNYKKQILYILIIILLMIMIGCDKIPQVNDYDDRQSSLVEGYKYLNENECIEGQTLFIGDSITEFYPIDEFFSSVTGEVYNRGISGDTSNRMLTRFQDNALNIRPRSLIINIGINDLNVGYKPQDIAANIDECVRLTQINDQNTRIVLVSIYPSTTEKRDDIVETNSLIQGIANKYNVIYVDVFDDLANDDGSMSNDYSYDSLHPSINGYRVITEKIILVLD